MRLRRPVMHKLIVAAAAASPHRPPPSRPRRSDRRQIDAPCPGPAIEAMAPALDRTTRRAAQPRRRADHRRRRSLSAPPRYGRPGRDARRDSAGRDDPDFERPPALPRIYGATADIEPDDGSAFAAAAPALRRGRCREMRARARGTGHRRLIRRGRRCRADRRRRRRRSGPDLDDDLPAPSLTE